MWDPYATERQAQYRFWFDVREPGAAGYAGRIGSVSMIYFWISAALREGMDGRWPVAVAICALLPRVFGGVIELAPRVVVVNTVLMAAALWWNPKILAHWWVYAFAYPPAVYATWTLRKLSRQERWEQLQLSRFEPPTRWRRTFLRWAGLRPAP